MGAKVKKKKPRPVFDSIRKPTAPPTRRIGKSKPDEKVYPSERGAKHKKPGETD